MAPVAIGKKAVSVSKLKPGIFLSQKSKGVMHSGTEFDPVQAAMLVAVIEGLALQRMVDSTAFSRNEARRQVAVIVAAFLNQAQPQKGKPKAGKVNDHEWN